MRLAQTQVSKKSQQETKRLLTQAKTGVVSLSTKQIRLLKGSPSISSRSITVAGGPAQSQDSDTEWIDVEPRRARQPTRQLTVRQTPDVRAVVSREIMQILNKSTIGRSMVMGMDQRADPVYRQVYSNLGGPKNMPPPFPIAGSDLSSFRYVNTRSGGQSGALPLAAGQTMVILVTPHSGQHCMIVANSATSTWGTISRTLDRSTILADHDLLSAQTVGYTQHDHISPIADPTTYKNLGLHEMKLLGSPHLSQDTYMQVLATRLCVQVTTPWDGMCAVQAMNGGTDSNRLGNATEVLGADVANNATQAGGLHASLIAKFHIPQSTVNSSAVNFISLYDPPKVVSGNSQHEVCITGTPDHSFRRVGHLDAIDAPSGFTNSSANNITPRNNYAVNCSKGMIVITNTGTVGITVVAIAEIVAAVTIHADDSVGTVPNLATMLRHSADYVRPCLPSRQAEMPPVSVTNGNLGNAVARAYTSLTGKTPTKHVIDEVVSTAVPRPAIAPPASAFETFMDKAKGFAESAIRGVETVGTYIQAGKAIASLF
jgi:hypothetical protein